MHEIDRNDVLQPLLEIEPLPRYRILLLGAGSGLGFVLAQRLAREGYQIMAGTRSEEKFAELRKAVSDNNGIEPQPFLADITQPEELNAAFNNLYLATHEKIHYLPVAAGGLEAIKMGIARQVINLKWALRTEVGVTKELAEQATAAIKALTKSPEAMTPAMEINCTAPLMIFDLLKEGDHLGSDSVVLNVSSSISDACDPDNRQAFAGPWFYYTVGMSKESGVRALRERVKEIDATHLNVVAPEIFDTGVGQFIDEMMELIKVINPNLSIDIPKVSRAQVAEVIFQELTRKDCGLSKTRTIYVTSDGVAYQRPTAWDKPLLPYF